MKVFSLQLSLEFPNTESFSFLSISSSTKFAQLGSLTISSME